MNLVKLFNQKNIMETLNFYNHQERKQIHLNNVNASKEHGVYDLSMAIGSIIHNAYKHRKHNWAEMSQSEKEAVFSDYNCFGAICGGYKIGGWKVHNTANPEMIHLKWGHIQIDPINKTINFVYCDPFQSNGLSIETLKLIEVVILFYGFKWGNSNSVFVNS